MATLVTGGRDMAERGTTTDFVRWVEPHLTPLARYAARRVAPGGRDEAVAQALIRAWQRWPSYDPSRSTPVAWLLGVMANESPRDIRDPGPAVVELVDSSGADPQPGDVDLARAVEGLGRRERQVVDLHYFVGVDVATVAVVARCAPETVEARLAQACERLRALVGDEPEPMDHRLTAAARRWQEAQPPPPEVPVGRLDESLRRPFPRRRALVVAALVLLAGGSAAAAWSQGPDRRPGAERPPRAAPHRPAEPIVHPAAKRVPFRALEAAHRPLERDQNGVLVTPFQTVTASGDISGTVHPGDALVFDAALEAPGLVSLLPCPDYTITVGTRTVTRQLNCAQVPFYASLVRSTGHVTGFRPVLPAGTRVLFRMRVTVPDQPGPQQVRWALAGPHAPGFSGLVEVTTR